MDQIPLSEVLVGLRAELLKAQQKAADQQIKFKLDDIEIELQVTAKREGGPKGGLSFSVLGTGVELGGEVTVTAEKVQTLRLKMTPVNEDGTETYISNRDRK